jgi:hypothetical protein
MTMPTTMARRAAAVTALLITGLLLAIALLVTGLLGATLLNADPAGAATATGLGGTAPHPGSSPLFWLALAALGAALALAAVHRLRVTRYRPTHHKRG